MELLSSRVNKNDKINNIKLFILLRYRRKFINSLIKYRERRYAKFHEIVCLMRNEQLRVHRHARYNLYEPIVIQGLAKRLK